MFELKALTKDAVPAAIGKAERYRLLNEPVEAESICLDVLRVDPDNQRALVTLLLAVTDQFGDEQVAGCAGRAEAVLDRLQDEYERAYYAGIICERRAKAHLAQRTTAFAAAAYDWLRDAMEWYERAERLRPPDNDDALLRWNTCARLIMRTPSLRAEPVEERSEPLMLE